MVFHNLTRPLYHSASPHLPGNVFPLAPTLLSTLQQTQRTLSAAHKETKEIPTSDRRLCCGVGGSCQRRWGGTHGEHAAAREKSVKEDSHYGRRESRLRECRAQDCCDDGRL